MKGRSAVTLTEPDDSGRRIAAVDALRGVAIAAMIIYHFSWNLDDLGIVQMDVKYGVEWTAFARTIAGTFIGLAGVSLVLATRRGFRFRPFGWRLAKIVAAAVLVSLASWYMVPNAYVFFGILHLIAFGSVVALPFLRLPTAAVLLVAIAVLAAPFFYKSALFNPPFLWWVGFTPRPPASIDYVPVFPWFAMILFGVVAGRLLTSFGMQSRFARWQPVGMAGRIAVGAGRWSLLIYLAHIPLIIAVLSPFAMSGSRSEAAMFTQECVTSCRAAERDSPVCEAYCACALSGVQDAGLLSSLLSGRMSADEDIQWLTIAGQCRLMEPLP